METEIYSNSLLVLCGRYFSSSFIPIPEVYRSAWRRFLATGYLAKCWLYKSFKNHQFESLLKKDAETDMYINVFSSNSNFKSGSTVTIIVASFGHFFCKNAKH